MKTITIKGRERVPVNKIARIVTSPQKYDEPVKSRNLTVKTFDVPLQTIKVPFNKEDLTGTKRGHVKIVGLIEKDKWLAKCVCGRYEIRNGQAWRKGLRNNNKDKGCSFCCMTEHLRYLANQKPVKSK